MFALPVLSKRLAVIIGAGLLATFSTLTFSDDDDDDRHRHRSPFQGTWHCDSTLDPRLGLEETPFNNFATAVQFFSDGNFRLIFSSQYNGLFDTDNQALASFIDFDTSIAGRYRAAGRHGVVVTALFYEVWGPFALNLDPPQTPGLQKSTSRFRCRGDLDALDSFSGGCVLDVFDPSQNPVTDEPGQILFRLHEDPLVEVPVVTVECTRLRVLPVGL